MKPAMKLTAAAAVALMAGTVSASAALIDFTTFAKGTTQASLNGTLASGIGWEVVGMPAVPGAWVAEDPNAKCAAESGGLLACKSDGIGVGDDDEVGDGASKPFEYVTVKFTSAVTLIGSYFLDLYVDPNNAANKEVALVTIGDSAPGAVDASLDATIKRKDGNAGFGALEGISLKGDMFTFWIDPSTNDNSAAADFALAAVKVAAVPLPAGVLLMGTALGGFGLMRRKRKA